MLTKFFKGRAAARVAAQKPAECSAIAQESEATAAVDYAAHADIDESVATTTSATDTAVAADCAGDVAACDSHNERDATATASSECSDHSERHAHADWEIVKGQRFTADRALYNRRRLEVKDCVFGKDACTAVGNDEAADAAVAADGAGDVQDATEQSTVRAHRAEAALRECSEIEVRGCSIAMPYVLWHCRSFEVRECEFGEDAVAPLWHNYRGQIGKCSINCAKALRQCLDMSMSDCTVVGKEFGWKCSALSIAKTSIASDYCLLDSKNLELTDVSITADSALQYVEDVFISKSTIISDDCLWNSRNVTIHDSELIGDRLGWYSDSLTLIDCIISSSQPLCYCKNLKIVNCRFERSDRAFEYSDVAASICGHIDSILNPLSCHIRADSVGEIINDSTAFVSSCIVTTSTTPEDSKDAATKDQE